MHQLSKTQLEQKGIVNPALISSLKIDKIQHNIAPTCLNININMIKFVILEDS